MAWEFKSHKELVAGGYNFIREIVCRYPECKGFLFLYRTPNQKTIPLDATDFRPHFATCKSPEVAKRRKKVVEKRQQENQRELFPW